ncbi:MAG TPA: peptidylprolyl isomerase [Limnobacter sp.]|uniref:FKBP-type peptidyl-prolyl cis-trans isomerase n=1 Tax=Limnobacter sp. TaxID=2003368 RepID=UPI002ED8465B
MNVEQGMVVTVDFELRDAQGEVIQPHGGEPIVYLQGGEHEVFPKLQEALEGKVVGEEVFIQLEPEDAFGDFDPDLMRIESIENFPEELSIGMQLEEMPVDDEMSPDELASEENTGFGRVWTVTDIADGKVVLDGNHPLAGMALRYHLKVTDIRPANEEEKANGAAAQSLFSVAPNPDAHKLN